MVLNVYFVQLEHGKEIVYKVWNVTFQVLVLCFDVYFDLLLTIASVVKT